MNKNTAKGVVDEVAGRAKRQAGEWTNNSSAQVKGGTQEIVGKLEKALGGLQDAAEDARHKHDSENANPKLP